MEKPTHTYKSIHTRKDIKAHTLSTTHPPTLSFILHFILCILCGYILLSGVGICMRESIFILLKYTHFGGI